MKRDPENHSKMMSGELNKNPEPLAGLILFSTVVKHPRCCTEYHPGCVKVTCLDTGRAFRITIAECAAPEV